MKSLEKATADYEKAKEKMEASKARYEADLKRFKAEEIAKTEAENLEIVKIIREMDMSIPELEAFKKRMKNELPGRVEIQKEETKADDESGKNSLSVIDFQIHLGNLDSDFERYAHKLGPATVTRYG